MSDVLIRINHRSIVMMRIWLNLRTVELCFIQPMPGTSEKGTVKNLKYSYPEPAQVPLGEKPKV